MTASSGVRCGKEKQGRFKQGIDTMRGQHWLDYDSVAVAVLIVGLTTSGRRLSATLQEWPEPAV
jgi:hypothetical protein